MHVARLFGFVVLCGVAAPSRVRGQVAGPSSQQIQQLIQQNPGVIRQRIQQYGLTQDQIRQRLQAAGLSPSLLDQFMDSTGVSAPPVTNETVRALDLLGLWNVRAEGLEPVRVDTGVVRRPGLPVGEAKQELRLFGLDIFRGRTTLFQPVLSGPVPPSYKVGPGDLLVLVLTGDVEVVHELAVTREGFILIPQVGQIFVNSLTMDQLDRLLRVRLGRAYSGIRTGTTKFDVTIARLRANQVYVLGEVTQPGAYQLASVATVLNAVYAAGGLTEGANFREITVRRRGEVAATLDLYDYLLRGDSKRDAILEQGDVVFVPVRGTRASISGAVIRPAVYELKSGETLEDLVRAAGGFRPEADLKRIAVHRIVPAVERAPGPVPRAVVDVALKARVAGPDGASDVTRDPLRGLSVPPLAMIDGDSVVVDSVTGPAVSLMVSVVGMVRKPGTYPWRDGVTLRDLVVLARGPVVGADLREAEVARLPQERSGGQLADVIRVPLDSSYLFERDTVGGYLGAAGLAFPPAGSAPEVRLEPYDQVTIFRQPQFDLQRPVHVTGEVQYPGTYALMQKDDRVSSLLKRAGGLLPTAYPQGGRFYRSLDSTGRVDLELLQALKRPGSPADVILQPGDSLHVPEYTPTVRVEGAVNSPTSVLYQQGAGVDYYIDNAGGYARYADKRRVSVRYANGSARVKSKFLFFSSSPTPGPGSVVTVPLAPASQPINVAAILANYAQIAASTIAIIYLVKK